MGQFEAMKVEPRVRRGGLHFAGLQVGRDFGIGAVADDGCKTRLRQWHHRVDVNLGGHEIAICNLTYIHDFGIGGGLQSVQTLPGFVATRCDLNASCLSDEQLST